MKNVFILSVLFISCLCANAVDRITASITVTNATVNGMTFTANGKVLTFTNNVVIAGTQVATNADATGCGSKTNLFVQISFNLFAQVTPLNTGSNTFQLSAPCGAALVVSASAGYASVTYSTNTCLTATPVAVPFASYYPSAQVQSNIASQLESDLDNYSTNSKLVDLTKTQTITGQKTLSNTNNHIWGVITSLAISGNSVFLTNGIYFTPIFSSPVMTNGVNYGQYGFSSQNTNGQFGEQFGQFATATGASSTALGVSATASGDLSVAIGSSASSPNAQSTSLGAGASANGFDSVAIGSAASADGYQGSALGIGATASGSNSTALGFGATASFANSTAIGTGASTTTTNQVMLGAPGISTVVQNDLTVKTNANVNGSLVVSGGENVLGLRTNAAFTGTNNFPAGSDIAFGRKSITTLANGANDFAVGTNVFVEVSGPSAAFSIDGMANGRDGKVIKILNKTGFQMTIKNESGLATIADRILTLGSSVDIVLTNSMVTFTYSTAALRWYVDSHNP